jgi:ubiquitin C-terminal hydrolase
MFPHLLFVGCGNEHIFGGFPQTSRNDNGFFTMFPHASFVAHLREVYSAENNIGASYVPLRLKVVLEVPYLSMPIPLHYNSKASTGLVGLENLGATCYLNALLQVCVYLYLYAYCDHALSTMIAN